MASAQMPKSKLTSSLATRHSPLVIRHSSFFVTTPPYLRPTVNFA